MGPMLTFAVAGVVALGATLGTVLLLRPHLQRLLDELCGTRARAGFWLAVSLLAIAICRLLAAARAPVGLALRRPLAAAWVGRCGEPHRGRLWARVAQVALVAGTLLVVLVGAGLTAGFDRRTPPLLGVVSLLRWGLVGLLLSLAAVAAMVAQYTVRLERHAPPAYGAGSVPPRPPGGRADGGLPTPDRPLTRR